MTAVRTELVSGFGDARLAVHRMGSGWPVVLLHGLFSSAQMNWIRYGHAEQLADAGFEVIMPDLRAHGDSDAPHDPAQYPADVLVLDALSVIRELGLKDYDLGGFSLGSRTTVRAILAGLTPRRVILGGMGVQGLAGWGKRSAFFTDAIDRYEDIKRGDPAYMAQQFMKSMKVDRVAARLLLQSVDDTPPDALEALVQPTLVVCGSQDQDNGSAPDLANALNNAAYVEIPGTHMSSVTQKELGAAMVQFILR